MVDASICKKDLKGKFLRSYKKHFDSKHIS